ncbi:MAG: carbohydrate binding family 9 domain-containing protein [Ignavibacteriae bacterium]|nr:carbohydrate binding family 9 domain-containing protein [Ignavibacteriota bacterium]
MVKTVVKYFLLGNTAFFLLTTIAIGGTSSKSIVAIRTPSSPQIDGFLDEVAWQLAVPVSGFQQFDPDEGHDATEATIVRVLYDDYALYVGVNCYDSEPDAIVKQLTRRDRTAQADRFSVIIDSYHDHATAFLFSGSVSGVKSDGILSQDGLMYDVQWDAVWNFDASMTSDGWSAEFKIPFSALRFAEQDTEYVWGINFRRYIARKRETDEWVLVRRSEAPTNVVSSVSKMGHLSGITNIHPPLHLELMPYQVSKALYLSQPSPFSLRKELTGTVGLDLKYGMTNNFTLDLAINPDFGQVEVDQAVLNLTVFETFYPEKRPFFLEGSQVFSFGNVFDQRQLRLFYSRRIGKRPVSPPDKPDSGYIFVEHPQTTTILGATKLTGKTNGGLSLGVLSAVTDEEKGIEEDPFGKRNPPTLFEPRSSYNILRLRQDILENSYIGLMTTGSFKDRTLPSLAGGVDWNLRFDRGVYAVDGYLAGSQVSLEPNLRLQGGTGRIGFGLLEAEHLLAVSTYDFSVKNFLVDDLGFYSQPREHGGYTQVTYKKIHAKAPLRRYYLSLESDYRWNWDGANTVKQLEGEPIFEFTNFWLFTLNYIHEFPAYDDANRGIIGLYRRPHRNRYTTTFQTDSRQAVVLAMHAGYNNTTKGANTIFSALQFTLRPNNWIEFSPGLTLIRTRTEETWARSPVTGSSILTDDGLSLFADRDVDEYDFSLRGTITFFRNLGIQFFTQVFLAKGQYSNFRKLLGEDEFLSYDYQGTSPDFNEKILNANFVLRWEYLPGSTLYVVWTQARYGDDGLFGTSLSRNFADTFKLPMDNVFLAKLSYWWSL